MFFWIQDGVMKNSNERTPKEALQDFRDREIEPVYPYAVSSVERNMFLAHLEEAIELAKPKDEEELREKAKKMLSMTAYTNWSGD